MREGVIKIPYPHEHAARIADPDSFDEKSFRSKDIEDGIRLITGKKTGSDAMTAQAYRFDSSKFTATQAKAWLKSHDITPLSFEPATGEGKESAVSLITGDVMRFRESAGPASKPGTIDIHIIRPGRGSSGYYTSEVLHKACETGVYPAGMLMHWDHPTRQQEEDQPARVVGTIAAALAETARYREEGDPDAWDGPGPYALAEVRPKFQEDLKWLSGKIGVSHYVSGRDKEGPCPDGRKGNLVTELIPGPFNSIDFVTIPGAGGHSKFNEIAQRRLKESQENNQRKKMADKQLSIRLSEIMTSDPEVIAEIRKQVEKDLKIDSLNETQKTQLREAADRIKILEIENKTLKGKLAEGKAREFAAAQVKEAKLPETAGKVLTEILVRQVPLAEDGTIDTAKFGITVTEAIKGKQEEIAAILRESGRSGIHDNGPASAAAETPAELKKAREEYRESLIGNGMLKDQADRLAGITEA